MKVDLKARTRNTARNTTIGIVSQLVQIVSSFFCRMVFVRMLAEAYLGVNGLFANVLSILALSELGIGSAVTYELYRALAEHNDEEVKSLMDFYKKAYTVIGLAIGLVGLVIMPFIPRLVPADPNIHEDIRLLYLFFLANTVISYLFSYRTSIIQAAQQNYILTLIHTAVTITQNVLQIIVLLLTKNFVLYLAIQVSATFFYYFFSSRAAVKLFPILKEKDIQPIRKEQKQRMFVNTKDLFITSLAGRLVNQTDNIIITALGGLVSTGLNSNYSLLVMTLISVTAKISDAIRASIGNVNAIESDEKKLQLFDEIHFFFFWFYCWCSICFIMLVQDVIGIAFGAKYVMGFSIAVISGINYYTTEQGDLVNIFKDTLGLFKYGKYMGLVTGIINVILSVLLGRKYGVFGILLASFISRMATTRWYYPYVTFKHGIHAPFMHFLVRDVLYWIEFAAIGAGTWYLCSFLQFGVFLNILCRLIICTVVPNAVIILLHHRDPNFINLTARLKRILKRRTA